MGQTLYECGTWILQNWYVVWCTEHTTMNGSNHSHWHSVVFVVRYDFLGFQNALYVVRGLWITLGCSSLSLHHGPICSSTADREWCVPCQLYRVTCPLKDAARKRNSFHKTTRWWVIICISLTHHFVALGAIRRKWGFDSHLPRSTWINTMKSSTGCVHFRVPSTFEISTCANVRVTWWHVT